MIALVIREAVSTGIIRPVETADFKWTVVSTIPCSDTTVIGHLVQSFAAVVGCCYRANIFARSIIAVLAKHGLEYNLYFIRIFELASCRCSEITVDAYPMHIVIAKHFRFTNNRYIVFCMASNNTCTTTHARVHVNRHSPMYSWLIINTIERSLLLEFFYTTIRF